MSKKTKKLKQLRQEHTGFFQILPIAFILSVIPLIVYLNVVKLTPIEIENWQGNSTYTDFFNYWKSQWLLIGTVFTVIFFLLYALSRKLNLHKSFIYVPAFTYALFIILSTVFSEHRHVALKGFVARYEGMITLLCYIALFLITFMIVKEEKQITFLLGALLISSAIMGIIGFFQFIGMDIFRTDFGKRLILPSTYHEIADTIAFRFEESMVFSTLSNPNYIGSYMVLVIPLAFIFFLHLKNIYLKVGSAILTAILAVNLFGSRSRAGLVGFCISILVALIVFRKHIFRRKVVAVVSLLSIVILFFGANYALNGALTKRIISEFNQGDEVQFFDLQDIIIEDNKVSIVSSTETLIIKNIDGNLSFYDREENELIFDAERINDGMKVTFKDIRYGDYVLNIKGNNIIINQKQVQFTLVAYEDSFVLVGVNGDETNRIEKAPSCGFKGKERLGSARGYIWSRTLPMLKDTLFIGYGPDTYAIKFPQNDYIGKIRAYGKTTIIVDKPHNMFLQIAVNTGVLSLIAVLVLWGYYIIQSIRLYISNMDNSFIRLTGAGIFIAISGYLTAAFFNDSVVGVAPIFWVLLALGFVCNKNALNQPKHNCEVFK